MGTFLPDFGAEGGRPPDLRKFLKGGFPGNPLVWIRDLVSGLQGWAYPWWIPPQFGPPPVRYAAKVRHSGSVVLPSSGCRDGGGGTRGGGYIIHLPPEYHRQLYRDSYDTGVMSGNITSAGSTGDMAVVGAGGYRHIPGGR